MRQKDIPKGRGGNVEFVAGKGDTAFYPGKGAVGHIEYDGNFVFCNADGAEWLRLTPTEAFVRGERVETNGEVFDAFAAWVFRATRRLGKGEGDGGDATCTPNGTEGP